MQNEEKRTGYGDRVMALTETRMTEDGRDDGEQRMNDADGGDRGEELGRRHRYWSSPTRLRLSGYLLVPNDPKALCQTPRLRTCLYSPAMTLRATSSNTSLFLSLFKTTSTMATATRAHDISLNSPRKFRLFGSIATALGRTTSERFSFVYRSFLFMSFTSQLNLTCVTWISMLHRKRGQVERSFYRKKNLSYNFQYTRRATIPRPLNDPSRL